MATKKKLEKYQNPGPVGYSWSRGQTIGNTVTPSTRADELRENQKDINARQEKINKVAKSILDSKGINDFTEDDVVLISQSTLPEVKNVLRDYRINRANNSQENQSGIIPTAEEFKNNTAALGDKLSLQRLPSYPYLSGAQNPPRSLFKDRKSEPSKIKNTLDNILEAVGINTGINALSDLSKKPGLDTFYDLYNVLNAYRQGDPIKATINEIGAFIPGLSGKVLEAAAEDFIPKFPEGTKKKMKFISKQSSSKNLELSEKYGQVYWDSPQFQKDYKKEIDKLQQGGATKSGLPPDYAKFLEYNKTAPENRQAGDDWKYGDPNDYDHYGFWDSLGKPKNWEEALSLKDENGEPVLFKDPVDGSYHGYSTNQNTGIWLKPAHIDKFQPGDTGWMEFRDFQLSGDKNWNSNKLSLIYDPEINRLRYVEKPVQKTGAEDMKKIKKNKLEKYQNSGTVKPLDFTPSVMNTFLQGLGLFPNISNPTGNAFGNSPFGAQLNTGIFNDGKLFAGIPGIKDLETPLGEWGGDVAKGFENAELKKDQEKYGTKDFFSSADAWAKETGQSFSGRPNELFKSYNKHLQDRAGETYDSTKSAQKGWNEYGKPMAGYMSAMNNLTELQAVENLKGNKRDLYDVTDEMKGMENKGIFAKEGGVVKNMQLGGAISQMSQMPQISQLQQALGYKDNSPFKNMLSQIINSNRITMDGVSQPLQVTADTGERRVLPPNSGIHVFPGAQSVTEVPILNLSKNINYKRLKPQGIYKFGGLITEGSEYDKREQPTKNPISGGASTGPMGPKDMPSYDGGIRSIIDQEKNQIIPTENLIPIQTEKGELIVLPTGDVVPVMAKKRHHQMDEDEVTDVAPEGAYILSAFGRVKIKKSEAEKVITETGVKPYKLGIGQETPTEKTLGDLMTKNQMTPAEIGKIISQKFPVIATDNPYEAAANTENKINRKPYLEGLIQLSEFDKMRKGIDTSTLESTVDYEDAGEDVEEMGDGGNPMYRDGIPHTQAGAIISALSGLLQAGTSIYGAAQQRKAADQAYRDVLRLSNQSADKQRGQLGLGAAAGILGTLAQDPTVNATYYNPTYINQMQTRTPMQITDSIANSAFANMPTYSNLAPQQQMLASQAAWGQALKAAGDARMNAWAGDRTARNQQLSALQGYSDKNEEARIAAQNATRLNRNQQIGNVGDRTQGYFDSTATIEANLGQTQANARLGQGSAQQQAIRSYTQGINSAIGTAGAAAYDYYSKNGKPQNPYTGQATTGNPVGYNYWDQPTATNIPQGVMDTSGPCWKTDKYGTKYYAC